MRPAAGVLALALAAGLAGCQQAAPPPAEDVDTYVSRRVIDGDTVDLAGPAGPVRVRILGIDAPEVAHDGRPAQCGSADARERLAELTSDGVQLVSDPGSDPEDRYGRRLAYLEAGGVDVGGALVAEGLVGAWSPPSVAAPARLAHYRAAEAAAQDAMVGSWGPCQQLGRS